MTTTRNAISWDRLAEELYGALRDGAADSEDYLGFLEAWASYQRLSATARHREPIDYYGPNPDDWPAWSSASKEGRSNV